MQTGVVAQGVRRRFGDVLAVDDIGLQAPAGQVTALVGPNGSGKTTLLLVLATLLVPDAGTVTVAGYDPVTAPLEVRRRTGWMPDGFGTWESLTAREVLEAMGAAYRLDRARASARATELLETVHLSDLADRPARVLSRGQKQRLGLARALVHDPEVLLLDEPANGLDPRSRIELRDLLRGFAAQGKAVLVSSHVLAELEEMADRAVVVARGRTVAVEELRGATADQNRAVRRSTWRLRALDPAALVAAVTRLGAETGPPRPDAVDVLVDGEEGAAELLAALVRDGVRVTAFAPVRGSLEETYLSLTQDRR